MTLVLRVGAPVYRMQVHGGHAASLVELATLCAANDLWQLVGPHYEHTSLLPAGRAKILHDAIVTPEDGIPSADILYTPDSDTWTDAGALLELARELIYRDDWTICGVIVAQDDGVANAWAEQGVRLDRPARQGVPVPAWAVGGACCLHNLAWHRKQRATIGEAWPWVGYGVAPTGLASSYMGEDTYHCRAVDAAGGKIWAVELPGTTHAAFGQRPTLPRRARKRRPSAR